MSRGGHGGRRKPYRGEELVPWALLHYMFNSVVDSDSFGAANQNPVYETPEDKLKRSIISLGEVVRPAFLQAQFSSFMAIGSPVRIPCRKSLGSLKRYRNLLLLASPSFLRGFV